MVEVIRDGDVAQYADFDNRYFRGGAGGVHRKALKELPIVDLTPFIEGGSAAACEAVGRQIRQACVDIGFFFLTGHGIPAAELDAMVDWGNRFFALPREERMKVHCTNNAFRQGYVEPGGADPETNPDKAADMKLRFSMSREIFPDEPTEGRYSAGQSQWPAPDVLPGFEDALKRHFDKRLAASRHLMHAFALSLDLPESYFDATHAFPGCAMIINYYPPFDAAELKPTQWSFSPHTDYGTVTLLSQDDRGGLQVRNADGDWIDVPPLPGAFVINIGDLFARWTNDLYTSNLHRVVNLSGESRISIPFFLYPHGTARIDCLETCTDAEHPPLYEPVAAADYMSILIEQSNRTGRPGVSGETARRFRTH